MNDIELSYIAGLLDADGWMSLNDNGCTVTWNIGIVNADFAVLDWIRSGFGGRVRAHSRPKSRIGKNWRQIYSYLPNAAGVCGFVEAIRPFLRIKTRQADILIEFLYTRGPRGHSGTYRMSPEMIAKRNEMLREIRNLNQVGRVLKLDFSGDRVAKDPNKTRKPRRWLKKPIDTQPEIATQGIAIDLTGGRQS